jgi:periplasmic protein TonB
LFVAALMHGVVILGVTFSAGTVGRVKPLPSLNVTLVAPATDSKRAPEKGDFLAERNQRGAGEATGGVRPTTTLAADHPLSQLGDPQGADLADGTPFRDAVPSAEQLVSRDRHSAELQALPQPTDAPSPLPQRAAALLDASAPKTLAIELDLTAELPKGGERALIATPSTQASLLAGYLDGWRRRVERVGTANFPSQFRGTSAALGRPTLEVAIGADGLLQDIVVRQSSGDKALDQAALRILRLAAPFDPLPANIRADYDVLKFAYEWDFFNGVLPAVAASDELIGRRDTR